MQVGDFIIKKEHTGEGIKVTPQTTNVYHGDHEKARLLLSNYHSFDL